MSVSINKKGPVEPVSSPGGSVPVKVVSPATINPELLVVGMDPQPAFQTKKVQEWAVSTAGALSGLNGTPFSQEDTRKILQAFHGGGSPFLPLGEAPVAWNWNGLDHSSLPGILFDQVGPASVEVHGMTYTPADVQDLLRHLAPQG